MGAAPQFALLVHGVFPQYLLGWIQGVLEELGMADEVFVK